MSTDAKLDSDLSSGYMEPTASDTSPRNNPSRLSLSIALGASYYIVAQLSRVLAMPPDLPSAIWPAAGVALASVLIWGNRATLGVFLGAWATNGILTFNGDAAVTSLLLGLAMASGATLQAWIGGVLVRRTVGYPTPLSNECDIIRFFVSGGPASCLIGASVGVGSLWAAGYTSAENFGFSWFTWWIGDSIGAVVFAPLMLVWFARSPSIWQRRRFSVVAPLSVCLIIVIGAFISAKRWESVRQNMALKQQATAIDAKIERSLQQDISILNSITGLYAASNAVDQREFAAFVVQWAAKRPGVQALEWVPRVSAEERAVWEQTTFVKGQPVQIRERGANGKMVEASPRDEYYPVTFLEPLAGNEAAIGYDLGSDAIRLEALITARDRGEAVASDPVRLVQLRGAQPGVLVFAPIYRNDAPRATVAQRRENLLGFAIGVFRLGDLACAALADETDLPVQVHLIDTEANSSDQTLAVLNLSNGPELLESPLIAMSSDLPEFSRPVSFAGRTWELRVVALPEYLARHHPWSTWMVLIGGMMFAMLFSAYLLTNSGRSDETEQLVEIRTKELELATNQANAATQAKSEFLAAMSHELRTPLTAILGFTQTLKASDEADHFSKQALDSLNTISRNGEHLLALINDILDLSKIEAGKLELDARRVSPFEIVKDTIQLMSVRAVDRDLELRCNFTTALPQELLLDDVRVRQILVNLLGNAIKFTEAGHVTLDVSAEKRDDSYVLRFVVSDTGIGMTELQLDRIFQHFTQADGSTSRKFGGTGLGLAISRRLAHMLGGKISVASTHKAGSQFTVEIAANGISNSTKWLNHDEYLAAVATSPAHEPEQLVPTSIGGRVLLAEDGLDNQRLIAFVLKKADVEVTLVENGREAVDAALAADPPFDLILMDMQMPVLDGYGAVKALRQAEYCGPIVALTANAMSGDRDKCVEAGCDDYTTKPIDRPKLLRLVAKYVAASQTAATA